MSPSFSRVCMLAVLVAVPVVSPAIAGSEPYRDTRLPVDDRVRDLVQRMTLEEKAQALDHIGPTLERFQLPSDQWNQCLNGVKWNRPTTLFPTCIAMGATWNPELVHEIATALSDEARAIHNAWRRDPNFQDQKKGLIYRAPVINISRNPYWGRIHEVYSEDPFLTGRMAVAYVRGLQGEHPRYLKIAATLKHYAVNNVETNRQKLDARVSERWLREYWLPHFREAVVEGRAQSLMASYNAINGVPNNMNHWLLTEVLKNEWNHDGFVVSDLGGVRTMVEGHGAKKMAYVDAVAQSIMAGCDFSDKEYAKYIPQAVKDGKLTMERLDDAVRRVMRVRMRLGEFDPPEMVPWHSLGMDVVGSPAHRALALKAARQSMVLLQNKNGLLPLDKSKTRKIAVIGPHADRVTVNNYNGTYKDGVSPLAGLRDRAGPGCEILHAVGSGFGFKAHPWGKSIGEAPMPEVDDAKALEDAVAAARSADAAVVFVGTNAGAEHEGRDRVTLALPAPQETLVQAVCKANPRTIVVLMSAGPLAVPWIEENAPAVIQAWWPGEEGGHAIADILFGDANPAGRLPYTVYASDDQVPPVHEYDISKGFTYMFVRGKPLYPFGHGLSYTSFRYSDARASGEITRDGQATVNVTITNTGDREGDEVVQLYVVRKAEGVVLPALALKGFRRVALKPGDSRELAFPLGFEHVQYWNNGKWEASENDVEVLIGASSADIRQRVRVPCRP